jgi:hypothetical protein
MNDDERLRLYSKFRGVINLLEAFLDHELGTIYCLMGFGLFDKSSQCNAHPLETLSRGQKAAFSQSANSSQPQVELRPKLNKDPEPLPGFNATTTALPHPPKNQKKKKKKKKYQAQTNRKNCKPPIPTVHGV